MGWLAYSLASNDLQAAEQVAAHCRQDVCSADWTVLLFEHPLVHALLVELVVTALHELLLVGLDQLAAADYALFRD